jgi:putative Holliday junction resolvase
MSRIMGIDYGSVRIGVSLSDETNTIAFGKFALENNEKSFAKILNFVIDNKVTKIIIGYPLNLKGERTQQTIKVEEFEEKLKLFLKNDLGSESVEVVRWDERFTSKIAEESMIHSGMKKKHRRDKSNIDIISSAILLQNYLDSSMN